MKHKRKRKRRITTTIETLHDALKRERVDYDNSDAYRTLVEGVQNCPENAGCYDAFQALTAFKGQQELTESDYARIQAVAQHWDTLKEYCPHCSKVVEKNRKTLAYQNYKKALGRLSQALGVPPSTVIGIEIEDKE